jgi:Fe-S cluster biogenesis protein NfuA
LDKTELDKYKETTMADDIKISGEPTSMETCRFMIDRPILPDDSAYFSSPEGAKGSPLAERLFQIDNVASVVIADNRVTVTQSATEDWPVLGKKIGTALREHIASGEPAIDDGLKSNTERTEQIRNRVQALLTEEINPAVESHGGMVSLIDVRGNTIFIQLGGGCQGCGMAHITLKHGIEQAIRTRIPEVGEILDTTDHASGSNPYYAPTGM